VRQSQESGILANATAIRNHLDLYSNKFPHIQQTADVVSISGATLLEELENSHNKVGIEDTIVITRSNKQANRYNEGIRRAILWKEDRISTGDYVMIVKNNYFWVETNPEIDFIANGDIARIRSIKNYETLYGFNFANVTLEFPDYNNIEISAKVMLDTLESESPSLSQAQNNAFYTEVIADYVDIKNKRTVFEKVKKNEYFNALQIKFAYAITCHKAQGGQWKHVYIDHGYMPEETTNADFVRWLYTAFTRASEKVYLVNFKKEFFE
jgi:exodeoxyribonuclease-5